LLAPRQYATVRDETRVITDEERDFIINCDIKCRMGRDGGEGE